jgi:SAM-dependent methyltransferase
VNELRQPDRAAIYARFGNPALRDLVRARLVPGGCVLDVGCASGGLLAELAGRAGRREGIEIDTVAAEAARAHADAVHVGDIETVGGPAPGTCDVVVLGDVLEHLADPLPAMRRASAWARPEGWIVVSLPNVAHWSIRRELVLGRWRYRDAGILDETHLRFFTWSSGLALLEDGGLEVVERRAVATRLGSHLPVRVPEALERRWRGLADRRPNLFAFQQLLVARPGR